MSKSKLSYWKNHPGSAILRLLVWLSAIITVAVMAFLVGFILIKGVGNLTPDLFALEYNSDNASLMPALINTLIITLLSLVIAVPFGIFAAIYLVEYAKKGSKLVKIIRITTETLQGIPSIIFGLFGLLFFSTALHWGYSLLAGAMTLVIMILPLIIRTTEKLPLALGQESSALCLKWCFQVQFPESFPVWYLRQDVLLVRLQP